MIYILLSTYNGQKYLEDQLNSLINQQSVDFRILVRDDGSTDRTCNILNEWQDKGLLKWYSGGNLKSAMSFMDLLYNASEADYYAFCDQDDVWLPNKLEVAVSKFTQDPTPQMYFGSQYIANENLEIVDERVIDYTPTFRHSLLNFSVTGCTMVINNTLRQKVSKRKIANIYMHDAWIYKVCMAVGGVAYVDKSSYILYRQHSNNVVGCVNEPFIKSLFHRLQMVFHSDNKRCKDARILLREYGSYIQYPKDHHYLELLANYKVSVCSRLKLLFNTTRSLNNLKHELTYRLAILLGSL